MFKKYTVTRSIIQWQYGNMPDIERNKLIRNQQTEVTFSVEFRPMTSEQREAGKRLFKRLIERTNINNTKPKTAKVRARVEAEAPPADHN